MMLRLQAPETLRTSCSTMGRAWRAASTTRCSPEHVCRVRCAGVQPLPQFHLPDAHQQKQRSSRRASVRYGGARSCGNVSLAESRRHTVSFVSAFILIPTAVQVESSLQVAAGRAVNPFNYPAC